MDSPEPKVSSKFRMTFYCNLLSRMSVCGWVGLWVGTFVRMCFSNFLFTIGPSYDFKSVFSF